MKKLPLMLLSLLVFAVVSEAQVVSSQRLDLMEIDAQNYYDKGHYEKAFNVLGRILNANAKRPVGNYFLARLYLEWEGHVDRGKAKYHYDRAKKYKLVFTGDIVPISDFEQALPDTAGRVDVGRTTLDRPSISVQDSLVVVIPSVSDTGTVHQLDSVAGAPNNTLPVMIASAPSPSMATASDTVEAALRNAQIGSLLEKQRIGATLHFSEQTALHIFQVAAEICRRRLGSAAPDYEEAERFADHVLAVASDYWMGYYLKTLVHLRRGDYIRARNQWKLARTWGYKPHIGQTPKKRKDFQKKWEDLTPYMIPEDVSLFNFYLDQGRDHMEKGEWIEADRVLIKGLQLVIKQTPEIKLKRAEMFTRLSTIAAYLGNCELSSQFASLGEKFQYLGPDRGRYGGIRCVDDLVSIGDIPSGEMDSYAKAGYGNLAIDLGSHFFVPVAISAKEGGGELVPMKLAPSQIDSIVVQGGGAYKLEMDIHKKLVHVVRQSSLFLVGFLILAVL